MPHPDYSKSEIEEYKESHLEETFGMNDKQVLKLMRDEEEALRLAERQKREQEEEKFARAQAERQEAEVKKQEELKKAEREREEAVRQAEEASRRAEQAKEWQKKNGKLAAKVFADWHKFYQDVFNLEVDFSNIQIPPYQQDFDRVLIIAQGLTLNQVFEACLKNFPAWKYADDLDKSVTKNDRNPTVAYAVRFRDRTEPDEELKNLSANDLTKQNIKGITLLERLIYELKYFKETGKHLDIQNITLCTGSRDSDGLVPCVHWYGVELRVLWHSPGYAYDFLRARAAV